MISVGQQGFGNGPDATAFSADVRGVGNFVPLFSLRRKMPRQALALKKNRCGASPISKASDNEHAAASLGHSEVLSVKHSVGEPIPEFDQAPENGTKVPSSVR
jgi:hypothetical protein